MPLTNQILKILLQAFPKAVSGERIATQLGHISRVTVHQYIQKLRGEGFIIEACRKHGYALVRLSPKIHPIPLQNEFERLKLPMEQYTLLPTIDSTNDEAARQLAAGRKAPFAIIALHQSKGRGRLGRPWHSESSGNLYFSLAFTPYLPPRRMQTFTLWMGVSACDFVNHYLAPIAPPIGIKWPNDLQYKGKKLCGILAEARMDSDCIRDLVIGIGINVNHPDRELPPDIKTRAGNLAEASGKNIEINAFSAELIAHLFEAYRQFAANRHQEKFHELWNRYDILRGKSITLHSGNTVMHGVAEGITEEGTLAFVSKEGIRSYYNAGDVSLSAPSKNNP